MSLCSAIPLNHCSMVIKGILIGESYHNWIAQEDKWVLQEATTQGSK